ncbi:hypothetical protein OBV_40890 [Oscillibacter valericigenes Sjm18-20]|nr:hypothetical protein OBV_40890 [Oscillibacter valericigenes Sjm18-20]
MNSVYHRHAHAKFRPRHGAAAAGEPRAVSALPFGAFEDGQRCPPNKGADGLITAARAQAVEYSQFLKQQNQPVEPLSAVETQVLKLLYQNLSNPEIATAVKPEPGLKNCA